MPSKMWRDLCVLTSLCLIYCTRAVRVYGYFGMCFRTLFGSCTRMSLSTCMFCAFYKAKIDGRANSSHNCSVRVHITYSYNVCHVRRTAHTSLSKQCACVKLCLCAFSISVQQTKQPEMNFHAAAQRWITKKNRSNCSARSSLASCASAILAPSACKPRHHWYEYYI